MTQVATVFSIARSGRCMLEVEEVRRCGLRNEVVVAVVVGLAPTAPAMPHA